LSKVQTSPLLFVTSTTTIVESFIPYHHLPLSKPSFAHLVQVASTIKIASAMKERTPTTKLIVVLIIF
jgi:hypothetical protein